MKLRALVGLVILPFAAYPLFAASLVALDSVAGERLFTHYASYERGLLLDTLMADYMASLPLMAGVSLALAGIAFAAHRTLTPRAAGIALAGIGAVVAGVVASLLTGSVFSAMHVALVIIAAVYCLIMNALVQRVARPSTTQVRA